MFQTVATLMNESLQIASHRALDLFKQKEEKGLTLTLPNCTGVFIWERFKTDKIVKAKRSCNTF